MHHRIGTHALAAVVTLALASAAGIAYADWPQDGVVLRPGSGAPYGIGTVQQFRDPSTDLLILWRSYYGSAGQSFYAQRVTTEGALAPGWPEGAVFVSYFSTDHPAAGDGAGGLYDIYTAVREGVYGEYLQRVRGDGVLLPDCNCGGWTVDAYGSSPAIMADGASGAYVAWFKFGPGPFGIAINRFTPDGAVVPGWPPAGVIVGPGEYLREVVSPALAADVAGGVIMAWPGTLTRAQRLGGGGAVAPGWPVGGLALGTTAPDRNGPVLLTPSDADHWFALWRDTPSGLIKTRLLMQRFDRDGALAPGWPAGGILALNTTDVISGLALVSDGHGGAWMVWEASSLPYMLHYLADGSLTGTPAALDADAHYVGGISAIPGRDGGVIVSWDDSRPSRPGVRARWIRYEGTPDPLEPDSARAVTPAGAIASNRGMLEDGQGGAYVAWDWTANPYWHLLTLSHVWRSGVLGVDPAPAPRAALALRLVSPNPTSGALAVRFTLASAAPARIELLDVAGRRVRSLEVAGSGLEQVARFEDLGRLPAGLYIVRLAQGGSARSARVAIVR